MCAHIEHAGFSTPAPLPALPPGCTASWWSRTCCTPYRSPWNTPSHFPSSPAQYHQAKAFRYSVCFQKRVIKEERLNKNITSVARRRMNIGRPSMMGVYLSSSNGSPIRFPSYNAQNLLKHDEEIHWQQNEPQTFSVYSTSTRVRWPGLSPWKSSPPASQFSSSGSLLCTEPSLLWVHPPQSSRSPQTPEPTWPGHKSEQGSKIHVNHHLKKQPVQHFQIIYNLDLTLLTDSLSTPKFPKS